MEDFFKRRRALAIILTRLTAFALIFQTVYFGTLLLSTVILLVLLSTYLIFSKPRPAKSSK